MKPTEEDIKNLVDLMRAANTAGGWSCDRVQACEGWVCSYGQIRDGLAFYDYQTEGKAYRGDRFKFCAWCGKLLDWQDWQRLKDE